jgi:deazaflavin-dependent oxidoreductase (nitroreductase family)
MPIRDRYLRPNSIVARYLNPLMMKLGFVPTLAIRGRTSGQWRTVPVNVLDLDGQRYLVSARGETDWVQNLRAAGGGELRKGSRTQPFTATEVPNDEKPRLIQAYRDRWDYQVSGYFKALPDPADHPVFRIEPTAHS